MQHFHRLNIIHPVHVNVGYISGYHNTKNNFFEISYVSVVGHPNYKSQEGRPTHPNNFEYGGGGQSRDTYSGMSRTFVRSALRSLRQHIPNLENIAGYDRVTGTHAIARYKTDTDDMADTSIRIPKVLGKPYER